MTSDFLLIQKIKDGDDSAGGRFVEKYYASIYQYCFLHIHDRYCAEDLTQEIFVRFFESVMGFRNTGKAKAYLYRIAGNIIKNYYRKKKEVQVEVEDLPEKAEDNTAGIALRLDIEKAVDGLPEELKEITILFFFQELKQKEIADLLGIKLSLVEYRVKKAKERLEVIYDETISEKNQGL